MRRRPPRSTRPATLFPYATPCRSVPGAGAPLLGATGDNPGMASPTLPLGRAVDYPREYDPSLLFPIPRAQGRASLGLHDGPLPFTGFDRWHARSEEHTSELPSLMRISYAVFGLKKKQSH